MNFRRANDFLSNPACKAGSPNTPLLALDFLARLRGFPTPRLKLMEDGAVRMRWVRKGREIKVYVRHEDVSLSAWSDIGNDDIPRTLPEATTVQRAVKIGLRWLAEKV